MQYGGRPRPGHAAAAPCRTLTVVCGSVDGHRSLPAPRPTRAKVPGLWRAVGAGHAAGHPDARARAACWLLLPLGRQVYDPAPACQQDPGTSTAPAAVAGPGPIANTPAPHIHSLSPRPQRTLPTDRLTAEKYERAPREYVGRPPERKAHPLDSTFDLARRPLLLVFAGAGSLTRGRGPVGRRAGVPPDQWTTARPATSWSWKSTWPSRETTSRAWSHRK